MTSIILMKKLCLKKKKTKKKTKICTNINETSKFVSKFELKKNKMLNKPKGKNYNEMLHLQCCCPWMLPYMSNVIFTFQKLHNNRKYI